MSLKDEVYNHAMEHASWADTSRLRGRIDLATVPQLRAALKQTTEHGIKAALSDPQRRRR